MIATPPGWSRTHAGPRVFLFPASGRGGIRYDERRCPRVSLDEIFREQSERVLDATHGTWTRGITVEGEHCATITFHGILDGHRAQIDLGVVLLDDCYALLNAYCFDELSYATFTDTVRELTRGDHHFLGVRRRRFEYSAPRGWEEQMVGLVAQYSDRGGATMTIWPALPSARVSAEKFATMLEMDSERVTCSVGEFDALLLSDETDPMHVRRAVILHCDRYIYPVYLEIMDGTDRGDVLDQVIASIASIPRMAPNDSFDGLAHWSD